MKNARWCTKKDTLQRLGADLHAEQAHKYTAYSHFWCIIAQKFLQNIGKRTEIEGFNQLRAAFKTQSSVHFKTHRASKLLSPIVAELAYQRYKSKSILNELNVK